MWPLLVGLPIVGYTSMLLSVSALDGVEAAEKWDKLGVLQQLRNLGLLESLELQPITLSEPQAEITDKVYLDVAIGGTSAGRIVIGLYGKDSPITADNFKGLCASVEHPKFKTKTLSYQGSPFHRVIPNFMIQGGDVTNQDGTGGMSIYGGAFREEGGALRLEHVGAGVLSMANRGPNTQSSQFFITTTATPHLNGKHGVFGCVVDGADVLGQLEALGSRSGRPSEQATVEGCGVL